MASPPFSLALAALAVSSNSHVFICFPIVDRKFFDFACFILISKYPCNRKLELFSSHLYLSLEHIYREHFSSYSCRFFGSERTLYASEPSHVSEVRPNKCQLVPVYFWFLASSNRTCTSHMAETDCLIAIMRSICVQTMLLLSCIIKVYQSHRIAFYLTCICYVPSLVQLLEDLRVTALLWMCCHHLSITGNLSLWDTETERMIKGEGRSNKAQQSRARS